MLYTIGNIFALINSKLVKKYVDPYNPLGLPANTVRVRTNDGQRPSEGFHTSYETATLVDGTTDVYDVYKSGSSFDYLLEGSYNVVEVLGANTTGITNMNSMFDMCTKLTTVPLFDTSNVTNMHQMFDDCYALTSVPLFDTSKVTNMSWMFAYCSLLTSVPLFDTSNVTTMNSMFVNCYTLTTVPLFDTSNVTNMTDMFCKCYYVETGALALYQQASTQANPPTSHSSTFKYCGNSTPQGAAELAQIPSDWK